MKTEKRLHEDRVVAFADKRRNRIDPGFTSQAVELTEKELVEEPMKWTYICGDFSAPEEQ